MAFVTSVTPCPPAFQSGKNQSPIRKPPVEINEVCSVMSRSANAAYAIKGFNVEPEGNSPATARGNNGLSLSLRSC